MPEKISQLKNKVLAWYPLEEDPAGKTYSDATGIYVMSNPRDTPFMFRPAGVVNNCAGVFEALDWLVDSGNKKLVLPREYAVSFWAKIPVSVTPGSAYPIGGFFTWAFGSGSGELVIEFQASGTAGSIIIDPDGEGPFAVNVPNTGTWTFVTFNIRDYTDAAVWYNQIIEVRDNANRHSDQPVEAVRYAGKVEAHKLSMFKSYLGEGDTILYIDEFAIFNSPLTEYERDWLYNGGSGHTYADIPTAEEEAEEVCANEITCCPPDNFSYDSGTATQDDGECSGEIECCEPDLYSYTSPDGGVNAALDDLGEPPKGQVPCVEDPDVRSVPASDSCVTFPLHVGLFTSTIGAMLYYTTDGSEPETSEIGTTQLYDGVPILLDNATQFIRVRPVIPGCPDYPPRYIQFNECFALEFFWLCPNTDKVGVWDVWTPNGRDDHNWTLNIEFPAATTLDRIEIYQLDADMGWTTGQAWATDNPIHPWLTTPSEEFAVFPLRVEEGGAPIVSVDYVDTIGSYNGVHVFDMFGDIEVALDGTEFFLIRLFTQELGVIEAVTPADNCVSVDPPCAHPSIALATDCGATTACVDVTITNPHGVQATYILARKRECIEDEFITITSGTINALSNTVVNDCNLPPFCNVIYEAVVTATDAQACSAATGKEAIMTATLPIVSIEVGNPEDAPFREGDSLQICVDSLYHDANHVGCPIALPILVNNNAWDTVDPNKADQCVTNNIAIPPFVIGTNTVKVTACNFCGEASDTVEVEVVPSVASCSGLWIANIILTEAATGNLKWLGLPHDPPHPEFNQFARLSCNTSGYAAWDGVIAQSPSGCEWSTAPPYGVGDVYNVNTEDNTFYIRTRVSIGVIGSGGGCVGPPNTTAWYMQIFACTNFSGSGEVGATAWTGYKTFGDTPVGPYTYLEDLCLNGSPRPTDVTNYAHPATLNIEEITP